LWIGQQEHGMLLVVVGVEVVATVLEKMVEVVAVAMVADTDLEEFQSLDAVDWKESWQAENQLVVG